MDYEVIAQQWPAWVPALSPLVVVIVIVVLAVVLAAVGFPPATAAGVLATAGIVAGYANRALVTGDRRH